MLQHLRATVCASSSLLFSRRQRRLRLRETYGGDLDVGDAANVRGERPLLAKIYRDLGGGGGEEVVARV